LQLFPGSQSTIQQVNNWHHYSQKTATRTVPLVDWLVLVLVVNSTTGTVFDDPCRYAGCQRSRRYIPVDQRAGTYHGAVANAHSG
jgi:hypothetical protein